MKPSFPNDDDPALSGLLQEWQENAPLPPRFQERVWQRIAASEAAASKRGRWLEAIAALQQWLGQPKLAAGYLAALLLVGFISGWTTGLEKNERVKQDLRSRYVQTIDPYQTPHH